jgi:signal transduction histidine kinase/GAF domain-containing protein
MSKTEPRALLARLSGERFPEGFAAFWQSAGFDAFEDFSNTREADRPPLTVLWVGSHWEEGLRQLADFSDERRDAALVLGNHPMPADFVARCRQEGGWAAASWPVPDWIAPAALGMAERFNTALAAVLTKTLQILEPELGKAPETLLFRGAELANELLKSDLALPLLGTGDKCLVLTNEEGGLAPEAWQSVADRFKLPLGLPRLLSRFSREPGQARRIRAFPTPVHLAEAIGPDGPTSYSAVVSLPMQDGQEGGIAGEPKPLLAAIFLFWREPHLPRMSELLPLKVLRSLAEAALIRQAERSRLTNRLLIEIRAQSSYSSLPLPGSTTGRSLSDEQNLLKSILRAYAGVPGLCGVWAQVASSSRGPGSWISLPLSEPGPPTGSMSDQLVELADSRFSLCHPVDPEDPGTGRVIAAFSSRDLALAGRAEIENLAADLQLAARRLRRERVNATLAELSSADVSPEKPRVEILRIAEQVRSRMDADGAKILVLRRHNGVRKIWPVCNTAALDQVPGMISFAPDGPGLANWALKNGKWLLIPDRDPDATGLQAEKALVEGGEEIEVLAFREQVFFPGRQAPPDNERTMLWMPLRSQGKVSGVVAVWREEPRPFDDSLDVESLARFAPHVAAACQRLLQLEKAREELQTTSRLAKRLDRARSLREIYFAIARNAGRLADAACALLLHRDSQTNSLSLSAVWTARAGARRHTTARLGRLLLDETGGPAGWEDKVREALAGTLPELCLRTLLVPAGTARPGLVLALLDTASQEPLFFSDDLFDHFTRSFLESASALLQSQVPAFASRLLDQVGEILEEREKKPESLLRATADLLRGALGADAVLYYIGTTPHLQIQGALPLPKHGDYHGFDVIPGSGTAESVQSQRPRRLLDANRHANKWLHQERLAEIARAYGWLAVGSWLSCPVVHDGRCRGLLKLLTSERGGFFGEDHERVALLVAERGALEMYKANRSVILEDLLRISGEIAASPHETIAERMVEKLHTWILERWMRPQAQVAVTGRIGSSKSFALAAFPPLTDGDLHRLEALSKAWRTERQSWLDLPPEGGADMPEAFHRHGQAEPVRNPGGQLQGHLVLIDAEPFTAEDQEAWRLAAADMSVLLNAERERLEEREKMGRFRHAALGPIQGLASAAKLLGQLAEETGVRTELLTKAQQRVAAEAETLSLWREHQRFYLSREVEIKPVWQRLWPVVESCVERFRPVLADRNIELELDWRAPQTLRCHFDGKAIDLVLANLLDNACKYAFYNRDVVVAVRTTETKVILWVEDVGHSIPEEQKDEIYEIGKRARKKDPYRPIPGEGLGLAMSKAIVQAHDGRIYHTSHRDKRSAKADERTPYRVRFTVELPSTWREEIG